MIEVEYQDAVAVVTLKRSVTNAIDPDMVRELAEALEALETDARARAVVLCSRSDKFFSIGFDIPHLLELSNEEFRAFYEAFNRTCLSLYTLPKPTVAAVTGHATAGGCILALCCDYRVIGEGRKLMGLNEVKLGLPVPHLVDRVVRSLAGGAHAREILELGEFYPPDELLARHLVDEVVPSEDVAERCMEKARRLGAMPGKGYAAIKQGRVEGIEADVLARWEEKERLFVKGWYTDAAQERLKAAMEKF